MKTPDFPGLCFSFGECELLLTRPFPGAWRLRVSDEAALADPGAAQTLARDLGEEAPDGSLPFRVEKTPDGLRAAGEEGDGVALAGGVLSFTDAAGTVKRRLERFVYTPKRTEITLRAFPGERFYGTGERFDSVERSGKRTWLYAVDRWCRTRGNSYLPIPFLLSSNASAVFLNRYERSLFDVRRTKKDELRLVQTDAPPDLYLFTADTPGALLTHLSRLTGFAPLPPEWAFGTLVCRYHPEFSSKEGVFSMARAMEENGFPWDAVILEGFRAFQPESLGELGEICKTLKEKGKRALVYEPCGRFPGDAAAFGLDEAFAVHGGDGTLLRETVSYNRADHRGKKRMRCTDLTSPEGRRQWYEFWDLYIKKLGVAGAKIDFCEQFPDGEDLRFADRRRPSGAHHWYPTLYNALQHRHFSERPDGGMTFSRGGGIGAQRYPFVWAGDQRREFFFLQKVINAALSLGLSGVPFVSWDLAGYYPALRLPDRLCEARVFLRGLEFTAFSPVIQTHGRVRRPYDFDEKTRALYRAYARLHDCLRDYLLEQARISCETGLPMLRHLLLHAPDDPKAADVSDEYLLGEALLVAPVLGRGKKRDVYLPEGRWTQIFTKETFEGPVTLQGYPVPPECVAVFRSETAHSETLDVCLAAAAPYMDEITALAR